MCSCRFCDETFELSNTGCKADKSCQVRLTARDSWGTEGSCPAGTDPIPAATAGPPRPPCHPLEVTLRMRAQVGMPRGPRLTTRSSQDQGQGGPQELNAAPSVEVQLATAGEGAGGQSESCVGHRAGPSPVEPPGASLPLPLAPHPRPPSGRYLDRAGPGRPPPGPKAPRSNPPGPGVGAGRGLECRSAGLPHSSGYSWTRAPKDPSPQLLGGQQRKECGGVAWPGGGATGAQRLVSLGLGGTMLGSTGLMVTRGQGAGLLLSLGAEAKRRGRGPCGAAAPRLGAWRRIGAGGRGQRRTRPNTHSTGSRMTT